MQFAGFAPEGNLFYEELDHHAISRISRDSAIYKTLTKRINDGMQRLLQDPNDVQLIRAWLGRRYDETNQDICEKNLRRHYPGIGQWLFDHKQFRNWIAASNSDSILWLTGPEGCGKSVLCSVVADRMRHSNQKPAVVQLSLAFDYPRSEYHLTTQLALQLLGHVLKTQEGVDAEILTLISANSDTGNKIYRVRELVKVLASQCGSVFIFIDGLDEVAAADKTEKQENEDEKLEGPIEHTHNFFSFLVDMAHPKNEKPVKLWCSSRHTKSIASWMQIHQVPELLADKRSIAADIRTYFEHKLQSKIDGMSLEISVEALDRLQKIIGSDFLFASMVTDFLLCSEFPVQASQNSLAEMIPKTKLEVAQTWWDRLQRSTGPSPTDNTKHWSIAL